MEPNEGRKNKQLTVTFSGRRNRLSFGVQVLRILGKPDFVSLSKSDNDDSLAVFPCDEKTEPSFAVPSKAYENGHYTFSIASKIFVHSMMKANDMEINKTYVVYGEYSEKENAVKFMLR